jgi:hypothetical protein
MTASVRRKVSDGCPERLFLFIVLTINCLNYEFSDNSLDNGFFIVICNAVCTVKICRVTMTLIVPDYKFTTKTPRSGQITIDINQVAYRFVFFLSDGIGKI